MDLSIKGHVAIVQGASQGIGRGIAEVLAAEGCHLMLAARNESPLREAAEAIAASTGSRVHYQVADTGDLEQTRALVDRTAEEFGRVDILVANSGGPPPGGVLDADAQKWIDAARLLVASPVELLRTALPHLEASPAPRFFVVTSSSTREPVAGLALSNVYRPGIVGLIKTLSAELGPRRVRCHSIAPGRIDTNRLAKVFDMQAAKSGSTPDRVREQVEAAIPAGRLGQPADIGNLVAFLSSPQADYLTGGNWLVDGGFIRAL